MSDAKLTKDDLRQFTGSEQWYRHGLVRTVLFTDGAKYVADQGGAYWLLDEIALAQRGNSRVAAEEFQAWKLAVKADKTATLTCDDGTGTEGKPAAPCFSAALIEDLTAHRTAALQARQPEIKPLGKTAGEIRLAWSLSRSGADFAAGIEERGLILVHVSAEEARASERDHAFAKAINRQNRALKEGFAVVDQRGNVTRIDQRTTGDQWEEIQKRLGGLDPTSLLSADAAREVMKEANRAEWAEQQRGKRESERPATAMETTILDPPGPPQP
jgi:hypothetical protein